MAVSGNLYFIVYSHLISPKPITKMVYCVQLAPPYTALSNAALRNTGAATLQSSLFFTSRLVLRIFYVAPITVELALMVSLVSEGHRSRQPRGAQG